MEKEVVIDILWHELLCGAVGKQVDVSLYPSLRDGVTDNYIVIQEAIDFHQADEASERFKPYIGEYEVFPILGTLGGNVVCIGTSETNRGIIYYYDFDFGIFKLAPSITEFMSQLVSVKS